VLFRSGSIALTGRKLGWSADLPSRIGDRSHWPGASRVGPRISPSRLRIDRTDRAQARSARGSPRVALTDDEEPPAPGTPSRNRRLSRPLCGMASRVRWRLNTIRVGVSRSFHSLLSLAAQRLSKFEYLRNVLQRRLQPACFAQPTQAIGENANTTTRRDRREPVERNKLTTSCGHARFPRDDVFRRRNVCPQGI
jgi:hypothetical protein